MSNFKPEEFHLKMLPPLAKEGIKLPAHLATTPADAARNPEDVLDYVPGNVVFTSFHFPLHPPHTYFTTK